MAATFGGGFGSDVPLPPSPAGCARLLEVGTTTSSAVARANCAGGGENSGVPHSFPLRDSMPNVPSTRQFSAPSSRHRPQHPAERPARCPYNPTTVADPQTSKVRVAVGDSFQQQIGFWAVHAPDPAVDPASDPFSFCGLTTFCAYWVD